jgi:hypothetical protein
MNIWNKLTTSAANLLSFLKFNRLYLLNIRVLAHCADEANIVWLVRDRFDPRENKDLFDVCKPVRTVPRFNLVVCNRIFRSILGLCLLADSRKKMNFTRERKSLQSDSSGATKRLGCRAPAIVGEGVIGSKVLKLSLLFVCWQNGENSW